MIFRDMFTMLPIQYTAAVLGAAAAYLLWMLVELIIAGISVRRLRKELAVVESGIMMHQGCQIENLPLISSVFDSASVRTSHAFNEMMQAAADYYLKKWIPYPADYINASTVSAPSAGKFIRRRRYFLYAFIGFLLSLFTFIASVILFTEKGTAAPAMALTFFPVLAALFFTVLSIYLSSIWKDSLNESLGGVHKALERKVPVFSENKGISLLVSQFIDYDRNMTRAVETLSDKIERFTMDGLVNAVTSSIESTLREAVFPSIERANDSIVALAKDIAVREDEGMKALALGFTTSLTTELSYQLKPFFDQIETVSRTLAESKNYMSVISQTINIYKQNAQELHSLTAQTLKDYSDARRSFSSDVSGIASSLSSFNNINSEYVTKINTDMVKFEQSVEQLSGKMDDSNKMLNGMLNAIFVEAKNTEDNAGIAQKNAAAYLESMNGHISRLSDEMAARSQELVNGMSQMMDEFFSRQSDNIAAQQKKQSLQVSGLLSSMEESADSIRSSTAQIKASFDELEEARIREAEAKAKKSFFKR
ncbi:MAG: hypothetical protein ACYC5K_01410 [Saccharofermentanales bacterium]